MYIYKIHIVYNACIYIHTHTYTSSIKITPTAFSSPGKMWPLSNFFFIYEPWCKPFLKVRLISSALFLIVYLKITYISKQKVYIFPDVSSCSSVNN